MSPHSVNSLECAHMLTVRNARFSRTEAHMMNAFAVADPEGVQGVRSNLPFPPPVFKYPMKMK